MVAGVLGPLGPLAGQIASITVVEGVLALHHLMAASIVLGVISCPLIALEECVKVNTVCTFSIQSICFTEYFIVLIFF